MKATAMNVQTAKVFRTAPLQSPTDLKVEGVREITGALNILLADVFALYVKTKNFHWHVSGPHFRDYHLLLMSTGIRFSPSRTRSPSAYARSGA
jgi:starvation-inducible DNA-binding protein